MRNNSSISKKKKTSYGVYIIESSDLEFKDGQKLHEVLDLMGFPSRYRSVSSKKEFAAALDDFTKTKFRYLHISCHADMEGIAINDTNIDNHELIPICKGKLNRRRVFFSACEASNLDMATVLIKKCGAQSIIGSPLSIPFVTAAIFWPAFYDKAQEADRKAMNRTTLTYVLKSCVDFFGFPMNYYHRTTNREKLMRSKFRKDKNVNSKKISFAS